MYESWLNEDIKTDKQKYLCNVQRYFLVSISFFVSFFWCQPVSGGQQKVVNISRIFLILINPILIHFEVKIISSQLSRNSNYLVKIFITLLVIRFFQFFISIIGSGKVCELVSFLIFSRASCDFNRALVIVKCKS